MSMKLTFPLVLTPEFCENCLDNLSTQGSVTHMALSDCYFGLNLKRFSVFTDAGINEDIVAPSYPGYSDSDSDRFDGLVIQSGAVKSQLPSWAFRQDASGPPVQENILSLWLYSGSAGIMVGAANLPVPFPMVGPGDGFSILIQMAFGPGIMTGDLSMMY